MFIEPGAPLVSFVYSDSDMDCDETRKQINKTSFLVDEHWGTTWLNINFGSKQSRFHEYIKKHNQSEELRKYTDLILYEKEKKNRK